MMLSFNDLIRSLPRPLDCEETGSLIETVSQASGKASEEKQERKESLEGPADA